MLTRLKLIAFDLDGVLMDSGEGHKIALNRSLREIAHTTIPNDRYYSEFREMPTKAKLEKLAKEGSIDFDDIPSIIQRKKKYTEECILSHLIPSPSIRNMLSDIVCSNIEIACVTNNSWDTAVAALCALNLGDETGTVFKYFLTSDDVARPKPYPDIYNLLIQKSGHRPEEIMVVEDHEDGVVAAKESGIKSIWHVESYSAVNLVNLDRMIEQFYP